MSDVTLLLAAAGDDKDPDAREKLLKAVYEELRKKARAMMVKERPGHTLQPTILANDAWLKLFPKGKTPKFENRTHFFAAAAMVMRRELVDHARKRDTIKRGKKVEISETEFGNLAHKSPDELIIAVDEALEIFAKTDKATAELVEQRFFMGYSMKEAAKNLGISLSSAERDYAYFKAWFKREFGKGMNS
jgi:RNA polymerase sigma factor (TIGR02999 family)